MLSPSRRIATLNALFSPIIWKERAERIASETANLKPEILLLQEVLMTDDRSDKSELIDMILHENPDLTAAHTGYFKSLYNSDGELVHCGGSILTTLPVLESGPAVLASTDPDIAGMGMYAVIEDGDNVLIVINVHGAWGGHKTQNRERQFVALAQLADELEEKYQSRKPTVVMGGDFNLDPESSIYRYLTGQQSLNDHGTFWVDAWAHAGSGDGTTLSARDNLLARDTAVNSGIPYPGHIPDRRIDYLLVKGWVYGRRGLPLSIDKVYTEVDENGYTVSDHDGLMMEIWTPESGGHFKKK